MCALKAKRNGFKDCSPCWVQLIVLWPQSGVKEGKLSPMECVLDPLLTTVPGSINYGHGAIDIFMK